MNVVSLCSYLLFERFIFHLPWK